MFGAENAQENQQPQQAVQPQQDPQPQQDTQPTQGAGPEGQGAAQNQNQAAQQKPAGVTEVESILAGGASPQALADVIKAHPNDKEAIIAAIQAHAAGGNQVMEKVLDIMSAPKGPTPTLRMGSQGEPVERLQNMLIKHGAQISADGAFGPKTHGAVAAFQMQNNLVADGIVGPKTWGALDGTPAEKQPGNEDKPVDGQPEKDEPEKQDGPAPDKKTPDDIKGTGPNGEMTNGDKFRQQFVSQLLYFEGATEGDAKFESIMSHKGLEEQRKAHVNKVMTTCNSFSGIMQTMAEQKSGVKLPVKINLHVMDPKWRAKNLPDGAWIEGGGSNRPLPGDIIVFTKTDGVTFQHMGNFIEGPTQLEDGLEQWECIDGGQGIAGKYVTDPNNPEGPPKLAQAGCEQIARVKLKYNPQNGRTFKGDVQAAGKERMVLGWIDIAKLANGGG